MDRVLVYPAFNARYYSMYLDGLFRTFGRSRVKFTAAGFPAFGHDCLALRFQDSAGERKVYLHSNDFPDLDAQGLEWCDAFGKVNLDRAAVPAPHASKVFSLGPTFAVRVWRPLVAEAVGLANFLRAPGACADFRTHMGNYRGQYASRAPEQEYVPSEAEDGYVFYNAAIWEREPEANALRARFVEACRSVETIRFEGGLSPRNSARGSLDFDGREYARYFSRRFTPDEYLANTRRSLVVLNNPAYCDCHSWRLGEYLALGKAIISNPIVRAVSAPLEHREHVHYVDGSVDELRAAIAEIANDADYRRRLETNARAYYEEYLAPASVVRRILARAYPRGGGAEHAGPGTPRGPFEGAERAR